MLYINSSDYFSSLAETWLIITVWHSGQDTKAGFILHFIQRVHSWILTHFDTYCFQTFTPHICPPSADTYNALYIGMFKGLKPTLQKILHLLVLSLNKLWWSDTDIQAIYNIQVIINSTIKEHTSGFPHPHTVHRKKAFTLDKHNVW